MNSTLDTPTRRMRSDGREAPPQWEDDIEHAWSSASDYGPGLWKVGFWLSRDFLSTLLVHKPWRHQAWTHDS